MKPFLNKKLVIAATAAAMLGGAAAAVAATQSSSGSGETAYLGDVASRLGVTPSALTAAIKAADSDQINAAVAAGRLTLAQAASLEQRIVQSTNAPVLGVRGGLGRAGFGRGGFGRGRGRSTAAATAYLGISEPTLRAGLAAGKSLGAIADATPGKSAAGLKAAIIAADTTALDAQVSAGTITSAQEQQRLATLSSRIDAVLQRTWTGSAGGNWAGGGGGQGAWARHGATGATGATGSLFG